MATTYTKLVRPGLEATLPGGPAPERGSDRRLRWLRSDWVALSTVWLASVVMNQGVGGEGVGWLDAALAVDRAILGLAVCYLLLPRLMEAGRYLHFFAASAVAIGSLAWVHMSIVAPVLRASGAGHLMCYHCYLTQTLPTVAIMAALKMSSTLAEQRRLAAKAGQERSDAELRFLRAQMNPHLLFNSLNNVYAYTLERSDRAPALVMKLSGVLRYMLYDVGDAPVPLAGEIDFIRDYIELQELAIEGRGDVALTIIGDPAGWRIAPMVLIALVENCFKHSVDSLQRILIRVTVRIVDDRLLLETCNSLPEEGSGERQAGGIGLRNLARRLALLYPQRHRLETRRAEGCFLASLQITLDR